MHYNNISQINLTDFNEEIKITNKNSFLLIDREAINNWEDLPKLNNNYEYLFKNTKFNNYLSNSPIIFNVNNDQQWLNYFHSDNVGAIILQSNFELLEIINHLKKLILAEIIDESGDFLFRFYDPRNLGSLLNSLIKEEYEEFLGPISAIFWKTSSLVISENSNLTLHKFSVTSYFKAENVKNSLTNFKGPWLLSEKSFKVLEVQISDTLIEEVINKLKEEKEFEKRIKYLTLNKAKLIVKLAIKEAHELKLRDFENYYNRSKLFLRFGVSSLNDCQYPWAFCDYGQLTENKWDEINALADKYYYDFFIKDKNLYIETLEKIKKIAYEDLSCFRSFEQLEDFIINLWPNKFLSINETVRKDIIANAYKNSVAMELKQPVGTIIISILYFLCGQNCFESPLSFSWLIELKNKLLKDSFTPSEKTSILFNKLKKRINFLHNYISK